MVAARRTAWTVAGALAVALVVVTVAVATGWGPLVGLDVRTLVAARSVVAGRPGLIAVILGVTDGGSPLAVDIYTAVAVGVLLWRRRVREAVYLLLVRGGALAVETALKNGLARPRPDAVAPLTTASGLSFPSGHTTGTTAVCVSLLVVVLPVLHRRARTVAVVAAVVVCLAVGASRVLLGVHYLSDVVGGLLVGGLAAVLLAAVVLAVPTRPTRSEDDP